MKATIMTISIDPETKSILRKIPHGMRSRTICELLKRFASQNPERVSRSALKDAVEDTDTDVDPNRFDIDSIHRKVQSKKRKKKSGSVL